MPIDLGPLQIHRIVSQLLKINYIKREPKWFRPVMETPPDFNLLKRFLPRFTKVTKNLKPKLLQPQNIVYPEDRLRKRFFKDHPWELARPRNLIEYNGKDAEHYDWSQLNQKTKPLDGESVVQRQLWLMTYAKPKREEKEAYAEALSEFYYARAQEQILQIVTEDEARMHGAKFYGSHIETNVMLEQDILREWRKKALALGHNQLSFFPDEIKKLSQLRYLNVRANIFKEFPTILCDLPSLEILDISRNKIHHLPREFGNLMSLKVLSISRNKLKALPLYIAKMNNLKILKIDHNPIIFPPKEITYFKGEEKDMLPWLNNLKLFLSNHEQEFVENEEQYLISESEKDGSNSILYQKEETLNMPSEMHHKSDKPEFSPFSGKNIQKLAKSTHEKRDGTQFSFSTFPTKISNISNNTESKNNQKFFKRTENQINYNSKKILPHLETTNSPENINSVFKFPKNNPQRGPDAYFKRFSTLPETKHIFLKSIKVIETSRGILFSLSQVYQGIRQYVMFCTDPSIKGTINMFLYTANIHIGTLTNALEEYETKDPSSKPSDVISTCCACIEAFKQVIGVFHKHIKKITIKADIRYTRTLLLLLYGAAVEIQNSWMLLVSELPLKSFSTNAFSSKNHSPSDFALFHHSTLKSLSNISMTNSTASTISASNINQKPISALSNLNQTELPNTHTSSIITQYLELTNFSKTDTDEHLFEKILAATTATFSVLTLLENAITQNIISTSKEYSTTSNFETTTKLKDLVTMSINTRSIAQKLKNQLKNIRGNKSLNYKQKFWEDTNAFVKSIISIAALVKLVSTEFPFSKSILSGLSTVTRSTKELTILLSISSFRFMAESQSTTMRPKPFSSTPQSNTPPISTNPTTSSTSLETKQESHVSPSYLSLETPSIDSDLKSIDKIDLSVTHTLKSI
ncbi:hypothetical protein PORY_000375 [Pneumocystis oryctolagi]|uniref:Uncharacterized protein n=1 Tax=Pneumocystis oryctolagi TaxID=42067 RepID=A0ACB7CHM3_9ASCO|nr:hypothetical protein PORY_000375 [Pneumocystis oryctolagi]